MAALPDALDWTSPPSSYGDAWRLSALLTVPALLYTLVYGALGSAGALVLAVPVPLFPPAFTLGYASRERMRRGTLLSTMCGVSYLVLVALAPPLRGVVDEAGASLLLPAWLVVIVALLGYAAPDLPSDDHGA